MMRGHVLRLGVRLQQIGVSLMRRNSVLALAVIAALLLISCGPSGTGGGGGGGGSKTVSVLGTWGGSEQDSFLAMVKPWEDKTGNKVQYEGTRDLNAVLSTRVQGGNPPDLAGLPGPGQMAEFAKTGKLIDLGGVLDQS